VIGKAPRGTVIEVQRNLGSWVAVPWPGAENSVAFMHVTTGTIAGAKAPQGSPAVESSLRSTTARPATAAAPTAVPASVPAVSVAATETVAPAQVPGRPVQGPARSTYVALPGHAIGLGARVGGSPMNLGFSARGWQRNALGVQVAIWQSELTSTLVPEHLSYFQLEPSVLYGFRDHVSDYVWVRPYAGAGFSLHRQKLQVPGVPESLSESRFGTQILGGAEFSLASVPRFSISADLGYRWLPEPTLPGFELGGFGLSFSGHWYVK
jgi:hypothetical protein